MFYVTPVGRELRMTSPLLLVFLLLLPAVINVIGRGRTKQRVPMTTEIRCGRFVIVCWSIRMVNCRLWLLWVMSSDARRAEGMTADGQRSRAIQMAIVAKDTRERAHYSTRHVIGTLKGLLWFISLATVQESHFLQFELSVWIWHSALSSSLSIWKIQRSDQHSIDC